MSLAILHLNNKSKYECAILHSFLFFGKSKPFPDVFLAYNKHQDDNEWCNRCHWVDAIINLQKNREKEVLFGILIAHIWHAERAPVSKP